MNTVCLAALLAVAWISGASADEFDEMSNFIRSSGVVEDPQSSEPLPKLAFPCIPEHSPSVPTSVHNLRPSDIKVVAALGDSITAALQGQAKSFADITVEYPGVSWSIGAQESYETVQTLPNILRKFNPNVYGGAPGTGTCKMKEPCAYRLFDAAVSGAVGNDMPGQLTNLTALMKADPNIDFENDWKVITMWIGANDLCRSCDGVAFNQPEIYIAKVEEALDQLVATIPNVYVNLVSIVDVNVLLEVTFNLCPTFQAIACHCITDSAESAQIVSDKAHQMQQLLAQLAPKYQNNDTYTVELQPFFLNTTIPKSWTGKGERSYLAEDCFHFSQKSHAASATALWNNMLEPVSAKSTAWVPGEGINCPTPAKPYLCTYKNECK